MSRLALILLAAASLGGCAALERSNVESAENNLAAAGFRVLPATTPERRTMLATLPRDHVSQRIEGEHVSYLYPDPLVCGCLYVGGEAAWIRFQGAAQARQIASDQFQAAQMNQSFGWDWGPWGGYGPGFY